jgi:glycosyltransferase involved in cell wall biosynthesis
MSMHVCFLCNEYPPAPHGGIGTFTRTLGRALVARGHEVTVVGTYALRTEVRETDEGVRVVRMPHTSVKGAGFLLNGLRLRSALRRIHRERPIDVMEGQENSLAMLPVRYFVPKIIRMNGGHHFFAVTLGKKPGRWRSWIERRSFRRADFLGGVSRYVADTTCELLGLDAAAVVVLPNPVDTSVFQPRSEPRPDAGTIVFVGTVSEKKGVRQLILAMPQILEDVPQAQLWVIGPDSSLPNGGGSFIESIKPLMPAQVASRVSFKGRIANNELPAALAQATVCVYPSHMEALPIAFLEGMAMGKAVVASQTGPGPEVIEHGVSGLLCDPHDPRSIGTQVARALTDADLNRRLGERALQEVRTRFAIDVLVDRNLAWYQQCIAASRGRARSIRRTTSRS